MTDRQKIRKKIMGSFEKYMEKAGLNGSIHLRISKESAMPIDCNGSHFFAQALNIKKGEEGGLILINLDFCLLLPHAIDYVMAHEIGHHIAECDGAHDEVWEEAVATLGHDGVGEGEEIIDQWRERRRRERRMKWHT